MNLCWNCVVSWHTLVSGCLYYLHNRKSWLYPVFSANGRGNISDAFVTNTRWQRTTKKISYSGDEFPLFCRRCGTCGTIIFIAILSHSRLRSRYIKVSSIIKILSYDWLHATTNKHERNRRLMTNVTIYHERFGMLISSQLQILCTLAFLLWFNVMATADNVDINRSSITSLLLPNQQKIGHPEWESYHGKVLWKLSIVDKKKTK